jgi:predicted DNA-binding protein with PD1-like motif
MIQVEAHRTRLVIARLDQGEPVHDAILEVARWEKVDAALVRGGGVVEDPVLAWWDPARRERVPGATLEGAFELVALGGSVTVAGGKPDLRLHATLARAGADGAGELRAGLLVRARVVSVELVLDVVDDAHLDRVPDATGLAPWRPLPRR